MLPKASWISLAFFALTSAALMGFLGCSHTTTTVANPSRIMAPSAHAALARQQNHLPPLPKIKPLNESKSARVRTQNRVKPHVSSSTAGPSLNSMK